jgi:hypothetical protein
MPVTIRDDGGFDWGLLGLLGLFGLYRPRSGHRHTRVSERYDDRSDERYEERRPPVRRDEL